MVMVVVYSSNLRKCSSFVDDHLQLTLDVLTGSFQVIAVHKLAAAAAAVVPVVHRHRS
jgi:hypothetical protein